MESDCAIEIVRVSGLTAVVTSSLPCVLRLSSETASVDIPWMPGISPTRLRLRLEEGTAHQAELSRVPLGTTFPSNGFWWAAVAFESLDLPTSEPVVADGVTTYNAGTVRITGVDSSGGSWLGPGVPGILPLQLEPWRISIPGPTLLCHSSTYSEIALASNSLYSGVVTWYSEPAGIEGTGNPLIIDPGDVPPGLYEVFVYAQENPWVWGVTHVVISHLDLSETTIYANASDTNLTTIGLSGNTYPQTGITVTSDPPGISNQTFCACDLEPGVYTVTVGNGSCETRELEVFVTDMAFWPIQPTPQGEEYEYSGIENGINWIAALFPPPACPPNKCRLTISPVQADGIVSMSIRHPSGATVDVPMPEGSGPLVFTSGALNHLIYFVDGPGTEPETELVEGDLVVRNVRHGDHVIFVDDASRASLEVAIIKNFTWSDVVRNNGKLPAFAPEFDDLDTSVKSAITGLFSFLLDPSSNRAQRQWIGLDAYSDSGLVGFTHTNFQANYPGLAMRDIPSARSVGMYPWDWSHFHLALATGETPPDILTHQGLLDLAFKSIDSEQLANPSAIQTAVLAPSIGLFNKTVKRRDNEQKTHSESALHFAIRIDMPERIGIATGRTVSGWTDRAYV